MDCQSILPEVLREVLDLPRNTKLFRKDTECHYVLHTNEKRDKIACLLHIYINNFMIPKCSGELNYEKRVLIAIFS